MSARDVTLKQRYRRRNEAPAPETPMPETAEQRGKRLKHLAQERSKKRTDSHAAVRDAFYANVSCLCRRDQRGACRPDTAEENARDVARMVELGWVRSDAEDYLRTKRRANALKCGR